MKSLNLKAYAKLNLFLNIKGKRPDWYHEIEAINTELDLWDEIKLQETDKEGIYIQCKEEEIPKAEYNLCYKAAELMRYKMEEKKGVVIELKKNVPLAAGLGGGSADAAMVMKGLNELWKIGLSEEELTYEAFKISSDTCYSIKGGTCLVKGKGEIVEKLNDIPPMPIIAIMPNVKIPFHKTKSMYKLYDAAPQKKHLDIQPMLDAIQSKNKEAIASALANSFHDIQYPEYKEVFKLISELRRQCLNACLCGSGPAAFGICRDKKEQKEIYEIYKNKHPFVYKGFTK